MDETIWVSGYIGIFSVVLLVLILRMKKSDPVLGCNKYRLDGCDKVSGRDCKFPDCATLEKYSYSGKNRDPVIG